MKPKAILVTNKTNIRYLANFSGTHAYLLLKGKKGFLFTDSRYALEARNTVPWSYSIVEIDEGFSEGWKIFLKKNRLAEVGIESGAISLAFWKKLKKHSPSVRFVDVGNEIEGKRIVKKPFESDLIERAQQITDKTLLHLKKWLSSGKNEKEIAWKVECLVHDFGADGVAFTPIIAINDHSAVPHHQNTNRKLAHGDIVLIDMGAMYKDYRSDMTRMIFTKTPTHEQQKIYELVLEAQTVAIAYLRAGVKGKKVDEVARNIIRKAGYIKEFGHSLGHGVGLNIHELPNLSRKYDKKIPAGAVVTVEPGIYLPGKFGVRLEDMVIVGKNGARNLTKSPKSIQESIVRLK